MTIKKKKKQLTPYQINQKKLKKDFSKERTRIKRFISRAEKRGYVFNKEVLHLIDTPKRFTERRIEKLKELNPEALYKKSHVLEDGKKIKGLDYRSKERIRSAQKASETRKRRYKERKQIQKEPKKRELTKGQKQSLKTIYEALIEINAYSKGELAGAILRLEQMESNGTIPPRVLQLSPPYLEYTIYGSVNDDRYRIGENNFIDILNLFLQSGLITSNELENARSAIIFGMSNWQNVSVFDSQYKANSINIRGKINQHLRTGFSILSPMPNKGSNALKLNGSKKSNKKKGRKANGKKRKK